jgi:hypothetical protein
MAVVCTGFAVLAVSSGIPFVQIRGFTGAGQRSIRKGREEKALEVREWQRRPIPRDDFRRDIVESLTP